MSNLLGELWSVSHKGDPFARGMYLRHYSSSKRSVGADPLQFVGPGESLVLVRPDAAFVWRRFIDDCSLGGGVNCALFRNEGTELSSVLIAGADEFAWRKWPHEPRHYTYVDPRRVRSSNPGFCFRRAGWNRCGTTQRGLVVLERIATENPANTRPVP